MKKSLLCLLLGLFTSIAFAETQAVGNFTLTYSVSNNEATVTDCSNSSGPLEIPTTLGGYPVTSIGDEAFIDCSSLTSVTIPSSVTSIGNSAFYDCSDLTSVTIPDGVTSIGDEAFYGCSGLTSVTIPSSVTSIGAWAFSWCESLTSVEIPSSVTSIGAWAFAGCSSLTTVTIPEGVTSIGGWAFAYCRGLTSVTIPSSVTSIGGAAFYDCSDLTSVTIPSSVTSIGDEAFAYCRGLTSVTIPEGVKTIGDYAFEDCSSLTSVTFEGEPPLCESSCFENVPATGYYLSKHADAWASVIDAEGKWNGLKMKVADSEVEPASYEVTVKTVGEGSVTGADTYAVGMEVTLVATASKDMVFCGWSDSSVKSATYTFTMPERAVSLTAYFAPEVAVNAYVNTNDLISKEDAKEALLEADEVFTADEMKEMAFDSPVVEVKDDVIEIAISLQTAESLDAWQAMALQGATLEIDAQKGQVRVKVPKGDKKAAFYKFVVPEKQ